VTLDAALGLLAAGLVGGVVTAIVGGSSLITFPVMLATGLPPVVATASTTVAITPGNVFATLADRSRIPWGDPNFQRLALISVVGSAAGAMLLLATPEAAFTVVVPVLIGAATLLFAAADRIRAWVAARGARTGATEARLSPWFYLPITTYGGYFGAAMSVMLLALLAVDRPGDFRTMNVIKNLLASLVSAVAVAIFVVQGAVAWPQTVVMMLGALAGGYGGGYLARYMPLSLVRWVVILVGSVLTVVYARRYW